MYCFWLSYGGASRHKANVATRYLLTALAVLCVVAAAAESAARDIAMAVVPIGDAGNAPDNRVMAGEYTSFYGAVSYPFLIGKYEVTIAQYTAFLNAVAASDPYGLYNTNMASNANVAGIARYGVQGSYTYSVLTNAGSGSRPVSYISWLDAARFANWMHNGATNGADTESGAYTLNGTLNNAGIRRNRGARWWIPTEDEWYKAAYYKSGGTNSGYWLYPTQSDEKPGNVVAAATNQANYLKGTTYSVTQSTSFSGTQNYLTDVGAFSGSASAYGTFDQAGNISEYNEGVVGMYSPHRVSRGGAWKFTSGGVSISRGGVGFFGSEHEWSGFRLAAEAENYVTPTNQTNHIAIPAIETVLVGDPRNVPYTGPDAFGTSGMGSVEYEYRIGKYEITVAQYCAFLNSVASSDPYGLYNEQMGRVTLTAGIMRSGWEGDYTYSVLENSGSSANRPITYVSWFDAARFCNWLHNGAGRGADTEQGAYTLNGATSGIVSVNPGARWYLPRRDEWHKAAYYKGCGTNSGYWRYPTQSDVEPGNSIGAAANQANCQASSGTYSVSQSPSYGNSNALTDVGSFSGSGSYYGTYDQAGNVSEWTDDPNLYGGSGQGLRGGSWIEGSYEMTTASFNGFYASDNEMERAGFRVAASTNGFVEIGVAPTPTPTPTPAPDPSPADSDSDGVNDLREIADGTDRNDPVSFNPLSRGMVAYYPFDGNANDESGHGDTGSVEGAVLTADRFSSESSAYQFDGATQRIISAGINLPRGTAPRSVSIWVKSDVVPSQSGTLIPIAWGSNADNQAFGIISGPYLPAVWGVQFWGGGQDAMSTNLVTTGWTSLVATYDGLISSLYVNGRKAFAVHKDTATGLGGLIIGAGIETYLGYYGTAFRGAVDDVRIYNRSLGDTEVERLFYAEAFTDAQRDFVSSTPSVMGHYSQADYGLSRTNGRLDVITNPSAFNLFLQSEYEIFGALQFSNGVSSVVSNPSAFGLIAYPDHALAVTNSYLQGITAATNSPSAFGLYSAQQYYQSFTNGFEDGVAAVTNFPAGYGLYTSNSIMDLRMEGSMTPRGDGVAIVTFQPQTTTNLATQPFTNNGSPVIFEVPMPEDKAFMRWSQ